MILLAMDVEQRPRRRHRLVDQAQTKTSRFRTLAAIALFIPSRRLFARMPRPALLTTTTGDDDSTPVVKILALSAVAYGRCQRLLDEAAAAR
jgi:hypothetical protein